jgi:hypothetical protein
VYLVVDDLHAARADLTARGAAVSEAFHEATIGGRFQEKGSEKRVEGSSPQSSSYGSFASFSDPDGNSWLLQEITKRLPGRLDSAATSFASVRDLADAMTRASKAHGEHEKRIGAADPNWPDWYAAYVVAEQSGNGLHGARTAVRPPVHALTKTGVAGRVRIVFTRCRAPYDHDKELIEAVRATAVLEVTHDRARPHPVLGSEPGGTYDRFRAVHDVVGHVIPGHGFDRHGEFAAWRAQDRLYSGLARMALGTELHGEHSVCCTSGSFSDHKATLLPWQMIDRARTGLAVSSAVPPLP